MHSISYDVEYMPPVPTSTIVSPTMPTSSIIKPSPTFSSIVMTPTIVPTVSPTPGLLYPPVVSPNPTREPIVAETGDSVEVVCTTDVAGAVISWHLADSSDELPEGIVINMTSQTSSTFSIASVTSEHFAEYICAVESGLERAFTAFTVFERGTLRIFFFLIFRSLLF